jgi:ferrous iron transport protein B
MLIMELPPYKRPVATVVLRHMWDRSKLFSAPGGHCYPWHQHHSLVSRDVSKSSELAAGFQAKRAALLQGVAKGSEPSTAIQSQLDALGKEEAGERLRHSFAGRMGHLLEPTIAPLGFDWKIGIGIVASFAAREVFVSTMSVVYNVGEFEEEDSSTASLARSMQSQTRPDGTPVYTTLTGITLMVFYVFALQCVSTVAVVRRETNSWKWPLFQWFYMGALAWLLAFAPGGSGTFLGSTSLSSVSSPAS